MCLIDAYALPPPLSSRLPITVHREVRTVQLRTGMWYLALRHVLANSYCTVLRIAFFSLFFTKQTAPTPPRREKSSPNPVPSIRRSGARTIYYLYSILIVSRALA